MCSVHYGISKTNMAPSTCCHSVVLCRMSNWIKWRQWTQILGRMLLNTYIADPVFKSMTHGSWGEKKVLPFFSFSFSESLSQYPTCKCTKGHRSRESNTNALEPFKFDTVQRQKYSCHWISCIGTMISNYLGWRAFGIEGVYVNLALPFVFSEF